MKDVTIQPRAVLLLEYLEAVRGLRGQPARDIAEYRDRRWWAGDIPAHSSCVLAATGDVPWLIVSKTQIPLAPPRPEDVVYALRIGTTDPGRESAFAVDFDDGCAGNPDETAGLRELLRSYLEGPRRAWTVLSFFANLRDTLASDRVEVGAPLAAAVADDPSRLDLNPGLGLVGNIP